jgi:hypothetical protein
MTGGWRNEIRWHLSFQVRRPNENNVRFEFLTLHAYLNNLFPPILIGVKVLIRRGVADQDAIVMNLNLSPSNSSQSRSGHPLGQLSYITPNQPNG